MLDAARGHVEGIRLHGVARELLALYEDADATLDDLREAVTTFEETERTARRVLGSAHPTTTGIENGLQKARTVLHASETRDMLAAAARTFARG